VTGWRYTANIAAALADWEDTLDTQGTAATIYTTLTEALPADLADAPEVWEIESVALDDTADQADLQAALDGLTYWADNQAVWIECYTAGAAA